MDETDKSIIEYLQKDGRTSYTEIANDLNVTVATVRNRVQKLIENNILKIVGVVDPFLTGMSTVAMLGLKVRLNKLEDVVDQIVKIPEVRFVAVSTGSFDLFTEIITSSNEELYRILTEELSKIDGIEDTDSSVILRIYKQSYDWGVK
ncbi:Lrp/AsnC family transcriptional regulator [Fodinisporobacter ferrooxydans]|uniref:Lrp/AsnC family transcriptional regulator n=1 Tax=Fodinisporobacter ferrooxydans TaxID=2901836 RepID=A0ABY4CIL5_9BACL|nr:Lrp/AsnC family transcriptional regulator [Alicyclobacillaceae bacterium MYW30-H2]